MLDESYVLRREKELRQQFPKMFSHPDALPGEVWVGNKLCSTAECSADTYRMKGVKIIRYDDSNPLVGKLKGFDSEFFFFPFFADFLDLIEAEYTCKRDHPIFEIIGNPV